MIRKLGVFSLALSMLIIGMWLAGDRSSRAGITCTLPQTLQNGTVADATQVMANFNQLVACFQNNIAASGANNDITGLFALTTPIAPAQGGTPIFQGVTSSGGGNVQSVLSTTPSNFVLTAGRQVTFIAGASNTGPLTLAVAGTAATNVFRKTQRGISAMVGGEVVANQPVTVIYDGTQWIMISGEKASVGEIKMFGAATAPAGWQLLDGTCQAQTGVYADLFAVIGTTYNTDSGCAGGQMGIPDGRSRVLASPDNVGGGAAGRITFATTSCNPNLGGGCGSSTQGLTTLAVDTSAPSTNALVGPQTVVKLPPMIFTSHMIKL